jgi:2-dehydropantoate 2-reductase
MRILIVGAGAIGGYFGGRLLEAGRDVTFLVRPARAARLAAGLSIRSPLGDVDLAAPPVVLGATLRELFDLILLSCKAYDLDGAMDAFAPAVGPQTAILPLLNGMAHLDTLGARFGRERVLGGLCFISAALDREGNIVHLNTRHTLTFGEQDGSRSVRAEAILEVLSSDRFDVNLSQVILQELWEKWVYIATLATTTCLMRATVGDVVTAGAAALALGLHDECAAIATSLGFAPRPSALERARADVQSSTSTIAASMLRDIERGARIEADHIVGALLRRRREPAPTLSLLDVAWAHLRSYEARRSREASSPSFAAR